MEEGSSTAFKTYLPPPLTVQSLLSCPSLSTELLGTLDGIAASSYFLLSLHKFSSLDGKKVSTSHCIGITSLKPDGQNQE